MPAHRTARRNRRPTLADAAGGFSSQPDDDSLDETATNSSVPVRMVGDIFSQARQNKRKEIQKFATKSDCQEKDVYNLVVDMDEGQIRNANKFLQLDGNLHNPKSYTSCLASAEAVFGLIKAPNSTLQSSKGDFEQLADAVNNMSADANVALKVRFGGEHGFVLVIKGNETEILQSFASRRGGAGAVITDSFSGKERRVFERTELVGHLRAAEEPGGDSQQTLFGGTVETKKENGDSLLGTWDSCALVADTDIMNNMEQRISDGLDVLNELRGKKRRI
jgi:hypothetical protein